MNPYNLALLFFSFCTFFISILIWLKRQDAIGRSYFVFSVFVTIWSFFISIMLNQTVSYEIALLSSRLGEAGAVFIPVTWFHFTLIFTGENRRYRKLLISLYILALIVDCFAFTAWFIPEVRPVLGFTYYAKSGPIFHVYTAMFAVVVPLGFAQLFQQIKRTKSDEKFQLVGFFIATLAGFLGGSPTLLPFYNIMVPQFNLFLMPVYPFIMAYFMIRHRLFDMEQIAQTFQREKLATIGLLAASINHEIRNPLYAVKGLLETYIENEKEGLPRKTPLETSEKALKQVSRALEVISKLNRFSKPIDEAPVLEDASVNEAVRAVLDLIAYEFSLEKIEIKNLLPNDLSTIKADPRQLEEILFNLIVNACHAMKDGGELTITCHSEAGGRRISAQRSFANAQDDKVVITITDTGTGISPEQAKHLFEPFHTTKGDKGTGLGLYITKQLIERNGGKISVQSKPGQGTSFILEFKAK